ncbi:CHR2 [Enterospora canceri]|uniref:CHR2 n=1 Tax=Enterospora canceri TaxID=1081671 RepID=A0A1Y1S8D9_9MICR|nr:CHR2 [Enterospora canceri]
MISDKYIVIPEKIRKSHREVFQAQKEKHIFGFLRKFLKWLEDDNKSYNKMVLFENPLKMNDNARYNKEFNQLIHDFLQNVIYKDYSDKKQGKRFKGEAHTFIGVGYEFGMFTLPKNAQKAYENYNVAAQLSNAMGTFKLAQCFEKGSGVSQSNETALSFYRCAAKLGLVDALHTYGMITYHGFVGSPKDQNTGYYYMKVAAKKADKLCPYPLYDLGLFYESGGNECGVSEDFVYALENFERGAQLGDPNCKFKLAQAYEFGDLKLKKNKSKSLELYKSAAESGSVEAQFYISECYLSGKTKQLNRNYFKSYKWAIQGAIKGHPSCAYKCGESAMTGTGTDANVLDALFWYEIAKVFGHGDADQKIKELNYKINKENVGPEWPEPCCCCLFGG